MPAVPTDLKTFWRQYYDLSQIVPSKQWLNNVLVASECPSHARSITATLSMSASRSIKTKQKVNQIASEHLHFLIRELATRDVCYNLRSLFFLFLTTVRSQHTALYQVFALQDVLHWKRSIAGNQTWSARTKSLSENGAGDAIIDLTLRSSPRLRRKAYSIGAPLLQCSPVSSKNEQSMYHVTAARDFLCLI